MNGGEENLVSASVKTAGKIMRIVPESRKEMKIILIFFFAALLS
jgi:DNA-directed RNA polymerase subunit F